MNIVGLFSGIGGLELPYRGVLEGERLLCDSWAPAQAVLRHRFPGVEIHDDIRTLSVLPSGTDLLTAGFPCTNLSQAGRTEGIFGRESGLIKKIFELLRRCPVECVVLENVRNMLSLHEGAAMSYVTQRFQELGYRWAYRVVDSRCTGMPQRRLRVILVARRDDDPARVLFADNRREPKEAEATCYGFYWTEGNRGIGWARNAIPPLKGGSGLGIPSAPGIWIPSAQPGEKFVVPSILAAERLQGFRAGWTSAAETQGKRSNRWKLVGNAVSRGVGTWVAHRVVNPGAVMVDQIPMNGRWPDAACGGPGEIPLRCLASHWPITSRRHDLQALLDNHGSTILSQRATGGFVTRLEDSNLKRDEAFVRDLHQHVAILGRVVPKRNRVSKHV